MAQQSIGIAKTFQGITDSSTKLAKNVAGITRDLVRWVGFGSVFTGLLGGGLFGLNRMAGGVASTRLGALGSGISYGQAKAFDLNYNRYGVGLDTVRRIADNRSDPQHWTGFQALGIGNEERVNSDPVQLTIKMMKRARDEFNRSGGNKAYLEARQVTDSFSMEQMRTFAPATDAELDKSESDQGRDAKHFDQSKPVQDSWVNLVSSLQRAGETINSVLVKGLASLTGPIGNLSDSFARAVETFLSNEHLKDWITGFGKAIERVAIYLGTDKFKADVVSFTDGVAAMASALGNIKYLVDFFKIGGNPLPGAETLQKGEEKATSMFGIPDWIKRNMPWASDRLKGTAWDKAGASIMRSGSSTVSKDIPLEGRALLDTIASGESDGTYADQRNKTSGARGRYQFLDSTDKEVSGKTGLTGFTPESQDRKAWFYAKERYGINTQGRDLLEDLKGGQFRAAALAKSWTSIPGGAEPNSMTPGWEDRRRQRQAEYQQAEAAKRNPDPSAAIKAAVDAGAIGGPRKDAFSGANDNALRRQLDADPGRATSFDSDLRKAVGPNPAAAYKAPDRLSEVGPRAPARLAAHGGGARVTVYNNTGGNAIVSAGMAAV